MKTTLPELISSVRMAETIEQEKFIISTEQAQIRAHLRANDTSMRPRLVSKLVFLDMLGFSAKWGQMETINLMGDERFSYKRIGYIGASVLLDETAELTILVTQLLNKDLKNPNHFIQCLALTFISNQASAEICREVSIEVQKLFNSPHASVLKRVGMATARIVEKNPDLAEIYKNSVQSLLNHSMHGVVIAGMNLVCRMIKADPRLAKVWIQFAIPFRKILKNLVTSRVAPEFSSGVFNDPFMQIKALEALTLLNKRSEELDSLLQTIINGSEHKRNTGRAILYQTVETIVKLSDKKSLRTLAFGQVARLLSMKEPNILYSALSTLSRLLTPEDSEAMQRYRNHVVNLLEHKDPSIRRRALDVITLLINHNNAETLVPEILSYVKLADAEFRAEVVSKVYYAAKMFSKGPQWMFDTVYQIFTDSGNYVSPDIFSSFCEDIAEIREYAVDKLSKGLIHYSDNQSIIQISSFAIGEYAVVDDGSTDIFLKILTFPQTKLETKLYIITGIAKLAARFNLVDKVLPVLLEMQKSTELEVQQRSGEMVRMLKIGGVCTAVLSAVAQEAQTNETVVIQSTEETPEDDLLLMMLDDHATAPAVQTTTTPSQRNVRDELLMLVDEPKPNTEKSEPVENRDGIITLFEEDDFILQARKSVNPTDSRVIALQVLAKGKTEKSLRQFKIEFQVSIGWQIKVAPPSTDNISNTQGMAQVIYLNRASEAPLALQVKCSYFYGSQPTTTTHVVKNI